MGQSLERLYRARIDDHNHTLTAVRYQSLPPPVEGAEKERKKQSNGMQDTANSILTSLMHSCCLHAAVLALPECAVQAYQQL